MWLYNILLLTIFLTGSLARLDQPSRARDTSFDSKKYLGDDVANHISKISFAPTARRSLISESEFETVNEILSGLVIGLPPIEETVKLALTSASVSLTNMKCENISIERIELLSAVQEESELVVVLELFGLTIGCDMDISWSYRSASGAGTVSVEFDDNYVGTVFSIASEDFASTLPEAPQLVACSSNFQVSDMTFTGDASVAVLNVLEGIISDVLEESINSVACDEIQEVMDEDVLLLFEEINDFIEPNFAELPDWRTDPLYPENSLIVPEEGNVVDFQNKESLAGLARYIDVLISEIDQMLGVPVDDPMNPYGNTTDLGLNIYLRQLLLDPENQELVVFDETIELYTFEIEDPVTEVTVFVDSLTISGLDKFEEFEEIRVIGSNTIQHSLSLEGVSVKADLTIVAKVTASEGVDSTVQGFQAEPVVESITIETAVSDIKANYSVFLAVDDVALSKVSVGYFLNYEDWDDCYIPPIFYGIGISGLDLAVGDIAAPTVEGFSSSGVDGLIAEAIRLAFFVYKGAVVQSITSIFQTTVRDLVNDALIEYQCPPFSAQESQCDGPSNSLANTSEYKLDTVGNSTSNQTVGSNGSNRRLETSSAAEDAALVINIVGALVCVCIAALAAGLTMGLLSLDPLTLSIKERAGATEKEKNQAKALLPIVRNHHLLLVSLLLMNSIANEALPLFLDELLPGYAAVIVSVTLVLLFGEILPTAVFTGPNQIAIASALSPVVRAVICILYPIAGPIAKLLDITLHDGESDSGTFNRGELAALVRIQHEERVAMQMRNRHGDESHADEIAESFDNRTRRSIARKSVRATIRLLESVVDDSNKDEIHTDEITMVEGALQMKTKTAADVYTPMREVFAIPDTMVLNEKNVVSIYRSGYSRIPVYEKNLMVPSDRRGIRGILFVKQLILINTQDDRPVSSFPLFTPVCIAPGVNLVDLVNLFQGGGGRGKKTGHMALVCARPRLGNEALAQGLPLPDEAALMGIVTLEDVIEELIQEEIYDEFDKKEIRRMKLASWGLQRWKLFVKRNRKKFSERDECTPLLGGDMV